MVGLVAGLEPSQDGDRVFHARLADEDRLEAPFEGRIFLDVLAILVERRRADAPQLAAGERRLQEVCRIGAPLRRTGTDHGVQFIDEQDHAAGRRLHLPQNRLQPILEFTAVFRARNKGAQVERDHPLVAERFRHVRLHDPQGQALGDRRLAHARLADQHGIVFRAAGEHLDHAADLGIAADHRIELALAGPLHEIDAIFFERLEFFLGILVGHAGTAADGLQPGHQFLLAHCRQLQDVFRLRRRLHEAQQQVVGRDKLVLHGVGLGRRRLEHLDQLLIRLWLRAAAHLRQVGHLRLDDPFEVATVDADLFQERPDDSLPLRDERVQEMHRGHLRIATIGGELHGGLHGLLGLDREFVESKWHGMSP